MGNYRAVYNLHKTDLVLKWVANHRRHSLFFFYLSLSNGNMGNMDKRACYMRPHQEIHTQLVLSKRVVKPLTRNDMDVMKLLKPFYIKYSINTGCFPSCKHGSHRVLEKGRFRDCLSKILKRESKDHCSRTDNNVFGLLHP